MATKKKTTKKKTTKKNPVGRPTKYCEEYCELLIAHMKEGLSFTTFAALVNVSRSTLYEWLDNIEFSDAKSEAEMHCMLFWEKMGIAGTSGSLERFNASSWKYNMICRFNDDWSEKEKGKDDNNVTINLSYDPTE